VLNSAVVRGLLLDLTPLRGREFRLLFIGQLVSFFGSMITFVALPFQMYDLTGSTLAVGALGICEFVPILAVALVSGALADAFDRRLLVVFSELGSAVVMAASFSTRGSAALARPPSPSTGSGPRSADAVSRGRPPVGRPPPRLRLTSAPRARLGAPSTDFPD